MRINKAINQINFKHTYAPMQAQTAICHQKGKELYLLKSIETMCTQFWILGKLRT